MQCMVRFNLNEAHWDLTYPAQLLSMRLRMVSHMNNYGAELTTHAYEVLYFTYFYKRMYPLCTLALPKFVRL